MSAPTPPPTPPPAGPSTAEPVDGPLVDELFAPLLLTLRDCLAAELAASLAGPVHRAFVEWRSNPPVMDGCTCTDEAGGNGDAWVRLVMLLPDSGGESFIRGRNQVGVGGCPPSWFVTIGIGSYRCVPVPEQGEPMDAVTISATSMMLHSDLAAYLRVLGCCPILGDDTANLGPAGVLQFTPIRAADCAGGELIFRVPVHATVHCPPQPGATR